jgi:hypothetical protein
MNYIDKDVIYHYLEIYVFIAILLGNKQNTYYKFPTLEEYICALVFEWRALRTFVSIHIRQYARFCELEKRSTTIPHEERSS